MKFNEVVEKLQNKNEGYLVLVRCGIFFVGVGKDGKRSIKRRIETSNLII